MISSEPMFRIRARLADVLSLGTTPFGERRIINIVGGEVDGTKLRGKVLPGGADWQMIDGIADIQGRFTIETETGARVVVDCRDVRHCPPDVLAKLRQGEGVDPGLRTVMRFETSAASAAWLNHVLALARGTREPNGVRLDVYELL